MSIKQTVKQALTQIPGNQPFGISSSWFGLDNPNPPTPTQIRRALRDIPYVRKLADGRYVVKGRKVPPKVDIIPS